MGRNWDQPAGRIALRHPNQLSPLTFTPPLFNTQCQFRQAKSIFLYSFPLHFLFTGFLKERGLVSFVASLSQTPNSVLYYLIAFFKPSPFHSTFSQNSPPQLCPCSCCSPLPFTFPSFIFPVTPILISNLNGFHS